MGDDAIEQTGVEGDYRGSLPCGIGVGSTLAEVEAELGLVIQDENDNLSVRGIPGFCLASTEWRQLERVD
ncbi:MAG: hypothetical protein ACI841_001604 [Planctomycetota bacterium]